MLKLLVTFCILLTCGLAAKYPSDYPKCRFGDVNCVKNAIEYIAPLARDGLPALNIVSLNPIKVDKIVLVQGGGGPVTLNNTLTNVEIFGIDKFHVKKLVGFGKDIDKSKFELHGVIPQMTILSDYKMGGRILVLPIAGSGKMNVTTFNNAVIIKMQPQSIEKNGKTYLKIKKVNYYAKPDGALINFTNLFGGDEALGRSMNEFLNQNWQEIFNEMEDVVNEATGKIVLGIINNIFSKLEYNELFINE